MPRIVYDASGPSAQQLERMAEELELSKVKALQLAVSVLSKLSEEVGRGTELVLRQSDGREVALWLPHLRRAVPSSPGSDELELSERRNGKHSTLRPLRHLSRGQKHA